MLISSNVTNNNNKKKKKHDTLPEHLSPEWVKCLGEKPSLVSELRLKRKSTYTQKTTTIKRKKKNEEENERGFWFCINSRVGFERCYFLLVELYSKA